MTGYASQWKGDEMPTLSTSVETEVDIDFDVYCGICGQGVCNDTDIAYYARTTTMTVTCRYCAENIKTLEETVSKLQNDIESLKV